MNPPTDIFENTFVRPLTWISRISDHSGHIWLHLCQTFDLLDGSFAPSLIWASDTFNDTSSEPLTWISDIILPHLCQNLWLESQTYLMTPLIVAQMLIKKYLWRTLKVRGKGMRSPEDVVKGRYLSRVTRCTKVVFNARLTSQDPLPFFIQFESATIHSKKRNIA